jgi:type I restriction enzyme S subunit
MALKSYKFGELIELVVIKNIDVKYGADDAIGVNINKIILPMRGDISEKDFSNFLLVPPNHFAYNPRGSRKLGLGFNDSQNTYIITFNNNVFKVKNNASNIVLNEFLFMYLSRKEFDRKAEYISWGSSTEVFDWNVFIEEEIVLPSIEIQQKAVDVYLALVANQKAYEKGLDDLKMTCDAYIEKLRHNNEMKELRYFIKETKEINSGSQVLFERGLNKLKGFVKPSSMSNNVDLSKRKVVRYNHFVYPSPHFGEQGTIGLFKEEACIMSQMYTTFEVIDDRLNPDYLYLWFKRNQFMRYAFFAAADSIRDTFDFEKLCEYKIPVPNLNIQQDIVEVFEAYEIRKKINESLKKQINEICPILIKGSIIVFKQKCV